MFLDSTLGGYHVFQITPGERWILDTKCFWASDGEVNLRIQRERMLTAFFAGEGLLCTVPYWRRRMELERTGTVAGA